MIILPTLQRRIRGDFFRLVAVFGVLGLILLGAVLLAGRVPTLMVRLNYDSIAWGREMQTAMNALRFLERVQDGERDVWRQRFEDALQRAERNITEPEEPRALAGLRRAWLGFRELSADPERANAAYAALQQALDQLVGVNEQAMFRRLEQSALIRDVTVLCATALFVLGTLWAVFMADGVSGRLSHPLRRAAEVFQARPRLGSRLHLPLPQTLEVRILFDELERLWSRLSELDALNVGSLRAEKAKLEVILESADDAILVLDGAGKVAHVSRRMLPLLDVAREEALGMPWRDLSTAAPNYLALREVLTPDLHGKRDVTLIEDGEEHVFTARCRDLVAPDGRIAGQVFLLGDVTESRRRERLRSEMMDWVSHELKTPMQSLGLAADLLYRRREHFDAEGCLLVETVYEDAARLRTLAQQFLDIARMTPSALQLSAQEVDLRLLLERWLTPFVLLARETGVALRVDTPATLPPVRLDPDRFAWVVSNLLSNALRVSVAGDEVMVRLALVEGDVLLEVEDQGPGLPETVEARLFEPFSHGRSAGTRHGLFGLGLAISRTIVDAHGGRIAYDRRESGGARFSVTLPLVPEHRHGL